MTQWIDTPAALRARTATLPPVIGLDTEFVRERTYWPQLALVQIALSKDDILLVDPLQPGVCEAIAPLLADTATLKLMHSPSEDLVAFQHACGAVARRRTDKGRNPFRLDAPPIVAIATGLRCG